MEKLITISIAAYNKEKYLDRCVQSLIIPSLDKVEIIIVNDGSTDRTSEIAHRYAERYPRSVRVIDKENGHYGSCANASLAVATGKYYKLLDADDYFGKEEFERFVSELEHAEGDMIVTTHVICNVPPVEVCARNVTFGKLYLQREVDFQKAGMASCLGMHGLTYKMDVLRKIRLTLTEGCCATDAEYAYYPIAACETVQFFPYKLYMYQTDIDGQDTSIISVGQKDAKYKVAFRMLADYCHNMSVHQAVRSNQRVVLERSIAGYYSIYILHFSRNAADNARIREMDKMLLAYDPTVYYDLEKVHCYKLHFVKWHRRTGMNLRFAACVLSKLR